MVLIMCMYYILYSSITLSYQYIIDILYEHRKTALAWKEAEMQNKNMSLFQLLTKTIDNLRDIITFLSVNK